MAIVERFFKEVAAGVSQLQIVLALNREHVPSTLAKNGKGVRRWNVLTLTRLLWNEKYIGIYTFNCRKQIRNPRTGRKEMIPRPREEWQVKARPELRIVSDELLEAAHEQMKIASARFGGPRKGGMNRTTASRTYIFSGLMSCAVCGGKINIVWGKPPSSMYGCHSAKYVGSCSNRITVSQGTLQRQLITCLVDNLRSNEFAALIHREFKKQLKEAIETRAKITKQHEIDPESFERKRTELNRMISNLLDTSIAFGPSPELSARHENLKQQLTSLQPPNPDEKKMKDFTEEQIGSFLSKKMSDLVEVIVGDPELAKREVQKRISKLVLTPIDGPDKQGYTISGDLRLFASPEDIMVDESSPKLSDHYTGFVVPINLIVEVPRMRMQMAA